MVLDIYNSARETRDNLGSQDENKNLVFFGPFKETIGIEMGPTILRRDNVGSSFVLGLSTNAILGTTELGIDSDYRDNYVERVINPNNIFHEHYRFDNFNDSTNSTATFSTTYYNVSIEEDEIYQTVDVFKNVESIQFATIFVDLTGTRKTIAVDEKGGQLVTLTEGQ